MEGGFQKLRPLLREKKLRERKKSNKNNKKYNTASQSLDFKTFFCQHVSACAAKDDGDA